jgi:tetratricopeptide (TPR) repeat protein
LPSLGGTILSIRLLFTGLGLLAVQMLGLSGLPICSADELDDAISDKKVSVVIELAEACVAAPADSRSIRDLLRCGRFLQTVDQVNLAGDCFEAVLSADHADSLDGPKRILVTTLAAQMRLLSGDLDAATLVLTPFLENEKADTPPNHDVGKLLHQLASLRLQAKQFDDAYKIYTSAMMHVPEELVTANELGRAWSCASSGKDHKLACRLLDGFLNEYPEHSDAGAIRSLARQCYLKQLETSLDSPSDESSLEALAGWLRNEGDVPTIIAKLDSLKPEIAERWATELLRLPLGQSTPTGDEGEDVSSSILSDFEKCAEQVALVRESTARWASRKQCWNLIAMCAEKETPDQRQDYRTIDLEKLFAESWMQLGRSDQSLVWWNFLVDIRNQDDFATLLRCAESETAAGDQIEKSQQRIDAALAKAGDDRQKLALVHLVNAQLAIRSANFDSSRQWLAQVVSSKDLDPTFPNPTLLDPTLLGRAQWLIGETFYLQRRFDEAIEAYREVEKVDPDGPYVAAALVQAGKSFEQLGRTRQAAICYGHLLSRFADSPHAEPARKRLARMEPMPDQETSTQRR